MQSVHSLHPCSLRCVRLGYALGTTRPPPLLQLNAVRAATWKLESMGLFLAGESVSPKPVICRVFTDISSSINGYWLLKVWRGHPTILSLFICNLGESPCSTPLGGFWGLCSMKSKQHTVRTHGQLQRSKTRPTIHFRLHLHVMLCRASDRPQVSRWHYPRHKLRAWS